MAIIPVRLRTMFLRPPFFDNPCLRHRVGQPDAWAGLRPESSVQFVGKQTQGQLSSGSQERCGKVQSDSPL